MPKTVKSRVYNPVTGKYYEIHQRSSVNKNAGEIKGLWKEKNGEKTWVPIEELPMVSKKSKKKNPDLEVVSNHSEKRLVPIHKKGLKEAKKLGLKLRK